MNKPAAGAIAVSGVSAALDPGHTMQHLDGDAAQTPERQHSRQH
jgi:hypothetical protein